MKFFVFYQLGDACATQLIKRWILVVWVGRENIFLCNYTANRYLFGMQLRYGVQYVISGLSYFFLFSNLGFFSILWQPGHFSLWLIFVTVLKVSYHNQVYGWIVCTGNFTANLYVPGRDFYSINAELSANLLVIN